MCRDHNNAYLMANHGALVLGTDLERAIHNVDVLEKCALSYLLALCAGQKRVKFRWSSGKWLSPSCARIKKRWKKH